MAETILISSFNCRGLRNKNKRIGSFQWLKDRYKGIIFLQETHSVDADEETWEREWGSKIYFAHGSSVSKGVAILMPSYLDIKVNKVECDSDGRLIVLTVTVEENEFVLGNIYAPTKDKVAQQNTFITYLNSIIETYSDKNMLIGGDFNVCLDPELDKSGGKPENRSCYCKNLIILIDQYSLIDIWRLRNKGVKQFTRRDSSLSNIIQSRLDYWFIFSCLQYNIKSTYIKPGYRSDHSILCLQIECLGTHKRGKGTWKFNNNLLNDKNYVELVKNTIAGVTQDDAFSDKNMQWEYLKCQIRSDTMFYAAKRAKEKRQKEVELLNRIENLENNLDNNETNFLEYQHTKAEWEDIQTEKGIGAIVRSKAKWAEYGEKNSKYFLNLEKRNYNSKYIKKVIKTNGVEISDPSQILQEQQEFYTNLYKSRCSGQPNFDLMDTFLSNKNIPKLNEVDKQKCDDGLTLEDLTDAINNMALDKSPGADGFTTNFYKYFWNELKQPLLDSYIFSFEHGQLADGQRRGLLKLIPKKDKDLRYLKSWRPVSLLATDYKILAKALAMRLQKVASSLVNSDQVGYLKGRYIGENIRIISDLMHYTTKEKISGILALIDFEKAFDTVEWSFLFNTLSTLNFGQNYIRWIKLLYSNISSCVTNNGYISNYFTLTRGIRQGCPISALLFILVAEILAVNIRSDTLIKGINVNNVEFKIGQLADDTTLFLSNLQSLKQAIIKFNHFGAISGLRLNIDKTELVPLGDLHLDLSQITGNLTDWV